MLLVAAPHVASLGPRSGLVSSATTSYPGVRGAVCAFTILWGAADCVPSVADTGFRAANPTRAASYCTAGIAFSLMLFQVWLTLGSEQLPIVLQVLHFLLCCSKCGWHWVQSGFLLYCRYCIFSNVVPSVADTGFRAASYCTASIAFSLMLFQVWLTLGSEQLAIVLQVLHFL